MNSSTSRNMTQWQSEREEAAQKERPASCGLGHGQGSQVMPTVALLIDPVALLLVDAELPADPIAVPIAAVLPIDTFFSAGESLTAAPPGAVRLSGEGPAFKLLSGERAWRGRGDEEEGSAEAIPTGAFLPEERESWDGEETGGDRVDCDGDCDCVS